MENIRNRMDRERAQPYIRFMAQENASRVLIVEDDPNISELLSVLLRKERRVALAPDGIECMRQIRAFDPDVILLDLMLPKMNGFEVIREIASRAPGKLERVIVLTAASEGTLRHFHEPRIYGLVKKPFDIYHLKRIVDACCAKPHHASH